jgi:hypothetical protein
MKQKSNKEQMRITLTLGSKLEVADWEDVDVDEGVDG